jgi:hypothetical protein
VLELVPSKVSTPLQFIKNMRVPELSKTMQLVCLFIAYHHMQNHYVWVYLGRNQNVALCH